MLFAYCMHQVFQVEEATVFINERVGWIIGNRDQISLWPSYKRLKKPLFQVVNRNIVVKGLWRMTHLLEISSIMPWI